MFSGCFAAVRGTYAFQQQSSQDSSYLGPAATILNPCGLTHGLWLAYQSPQLQVHLIHAISNLHVRRLNYLQGIEDSDPAVLCLLQEMAKVAADLGLTFGLEVINRYESNILNTGHQVGYNEI